MICPICKKEIPDNSKKCPECKFDFDLNFKINLVILTIIVVFILFVFHSCTKILKTTPSAPPKTYSYSQTQAAEAYIHTLLASGVIKEIKDECGDGTKGCYYFVIDENLWNTKMNYDSKETLVKSAEIYVKSKYSDGFYVGESYSTGKKLFDAWGVK